jgi:hypothetical protein
MTRSPSEAELAATWHARRCAVCGAEVIAVILPCDGVDEINLCAAHFVARLPQQRRVTDRHHPKRRTS